MLCFQPPKVGGRKYKYLVKSLRLPDGSAKKIWFTGDGNGRVGRFLANVILLNNKYPPLIIRKTSRQAYFSALGAFDAGHSGRLERFFLGRFEDTFRKFFGIYARYL